MAQFSTLSDEAFSDAMHALSVLKEQELEYERFDGQQNNAFHLLSDDDEKKDTNTETNLVFKTCRIQLCSWCYKLTDHFKLPREVVAYAMYYFDGVCQNLFASSSMVTEGHLKTIMAGSLRLSCKVHLHDRSVAENLSRILPRLSSGLLTPEVMLKMEMVILRSLAFKIHPPLAFRFIQELHTALEFFIKRKKSSGPPDDMIAEVKGLSVYIAELTVSSQALQKERPSIIALAAILTSLRCAQKAKATPQNNCSFACEALIILLEQDLCSLVDNVDPHKLSSLCTTLQKCFDEQNIDDGSSVLIGSDPAMAYYNNGWTRSPNSVAQHE